MPRHLTKRSKVRVFALLLGLSLVAAVMPPALTASFSNVMQVLVPLQHAMSAVVPEGSNYVEPLDAEAVEKLIAENIVQLNQIASMSARILELEQTNRELTRIRGLGLPTGRLIPARVVAGDSLPWRESKLIDRGTLRGIRKRQKVHSNQLTLAAGQGHAIRGGMSILAGETYVGEIVDVSTHTARLMLVTDPQSTPLWVRIARKADAESIGPPEMLLKGIGDGRMRIEDVSYSDVESGKINVGDIVVTTGEDSRLPLFVAVGKIVEIKRDDDNAVLYKLTVEPILDLDRLRRVFVLDQANS